MTQVLWKRLGGIRCKHILCVGYYRPAFLFLDIWPPWPELSKPNISRHRGTAGQEILWQVSCSFYAWTQGGFHLFSCLCGQWSKPENDSLKAGKDRAEFFKKISTHLLARLGWFCPVVSEPVKPYFTRFLRVLTFCLDASKIVIFCENGVVNGVVKQS